MTDHQLSTSTPPMATTDRSSAGDFHENDSYFFQTYVPLSNLPTPPLSSHSNSSSRTELSDLGFDQDLDPGLLGPAIHLGNLIPSSVSLIDPCFRVVHAILVRANLPLPTVALAACILDSLNSRFALLWRRSCPLSSPSGLVSQQAHIDSVRPEVIILAALILSVKFLHDTECPTSFYSADWGAARWGCGQINATEQCIMENLGYRILPLWTEELIGDALEDMEMVGKYATSHLQRLPLQEKELNSTPISTRKAEWSVGKELTPALTPKSENVQRTIDITTGAKQILDANGENKFSDAAMLWSTDKETFPLYTEPVLDS